MANTDLHPRGVYCAAMTPLTEDYAPDHAAFVAHAKGLLDQGSDGIALLGTTGEANSFSTAQRKALLEAAVEGGIAPARLMPGTGVPALMETVDLTRHAVALGVPAVVMLPPFYYKTASDEGLFAAYSEVIERVGDDRLKVVLYHIPHISGVAISHGLIERLRARYPDTVTGIKDSAGDFANMEAIIARFPGFAVLTGADPLMLPLLKIGGAGCITATSNLVAADLATVYRGYDDPAQAEAVEAAQARVTAARERVVGPAQMATIKALLAQATGNAGWNRLCPPLLPLSADERARLLDA
ncbi:dihydrodipicolinate synthase family protein [Methylobacterium sp. NEAU 140]|uniref:dihydrodipicolinate synthase family protein n=1 Tax=Methylobacterium sp. NEAU 140 TaxID=3064945 RepID=UPI002735F5AC|nr:dihydrodipicolinate synthase family protein [Methylobacterium sp. NEAU 140]MDP4023528.1 dihydrodipicolinate synthase family protein [Methylobacterium sp. NEAU 140]